MMISSLFFALSVALAYSSDIDLFGEAESDEVEVEAWGSSQPAYDVVAPPSTSPHARGIGTAPVVDVVKIDSRDSFCLSDAQTTICIPDAERIRTEVDDEDPEPDPVDVLQVIQAQVERDVVNLRVPPARINWQPHQPDVLVNMDTVFYTEAEVEFLASTILGYGVTVELTPSHYRWDYGDASAPFGTTDQGGPYPNHSISHAYSSAGSYFVSLSTTWDARFRVEGLSGWIPVSGQPVTVDEAGPINAVTKSSHLVYLD